MKPPFIGIASMFPASPLISSRSAEASESQSLIETLKKKNNELQRTQKIATDRIAYLMQQVDGLMERLEHRDEQIKLLEQRLTRQNRRALALNSKGKSFQDEELESQELGSTLKLIDSRKEDIGKQFLTTERTLAEIDNLLEDL